MRVLFAGATGVIGRYAVPELVRRGHEVHGSTRSWLGEAKVRRWGGHPVTMDALDPLQVRDAVRDLRPDVVVNMLTDLKSPPSLRRLDADTATTNHLRTVVTDALLEAALDVGARRYVAQSFAGWFNEPADPLSRADGPPELLADPPGPTVQTVAALRHLEASVTSARGGVVLRFGPLYGRHTSVADGGQVVEDIQRRRIPIIGSGQGVWSFCHVEDAAHAITLAVESEATGTFEVVDNEPARVSEWLPELAEAVGARAPRRIPVWLARPLVGDFGVHLMTTAHGASNDAAARELGFKPRHETWRDGFRQLLAA